MLGAVDDLSGAGGQVVVICVAAVQLVGLVEALKMLTRSKRSDESSLCYTSTDVYKSSLCKRKGVQGVFVIFSSSDCFVVCQNWLD